METMRGYKVFDNDWVCSPAGTPKQYACPGKFEEDVVPKAGEIGMHFHKNLTSCFNNIYYRMRRGRVRYAEVVAYGDIDKSELCEDVYSTNKLEIVREVPFDDVIKITCAYEDNEGIFNSGRHNRGGGNSGNCNNGYMNSGSYNRGSSNSGSDNEGDNNSGFSNKGKFNSGNYNNGSFNSGDGNFGSYNSGSYNNCSYSFGCFNTVSPQNIMLFNKPSDWNLNDWEYSDANDALSDLFAEYHYRLSKWVDYKDMSNDEKERNPLASKLGGYLKINRSGRVSIQDNIELLQQVWDEMPLDKRQAVRDIPNFDDTIFTQCTGIIARMSPPIESKNNMQA